MENAVHTLAPTNTCEVAADPKLLVGAVAGVLVVTENPNPAQLTRRGLLDEKGLFVLARQDAHSELRTHRADSTRKADAFRRIRACAEQGKLIEERLATRLLPQHGPTQLLSSRALLRTPLFRVAGKQCPREPSTKVVLASQPQVIYRGPELRQPDGLVFATLLHMARDVLLGTPVSFHPKQVCQTLYGRYDGNTRHQLTEHIQRLQGGVVAFDAFSIQLCLGFDYPARGRWSVALDPNIIELFRDNSHVWLELGTRLKLPEGLTTWLYGYVRSQTRLIPTRLETLREACGSEAGDKPFMNVMRSALHELTDVGAVDPGWSLGQGMVRWMKGPQG